MQGTLCFKEIQTNLLASEAKRSDHDTVNHRAPESVPCMKALSTTILDDITVDKHGIDIPFQSTTLCGLVGSISERCVTDIHVSCILGSRQQLCHAQVLRNSLELVSDPSKWVPGRSTHIMTPMTKVETVVPTKEKSASGIRLDRKLWEGRKKREGLSH